MNFWTWSDFGWYPGIGGFGVFLGTYLGMVYLGMCVFGVYIFACFGLWGILVNSWYVFVCYLFCVVILGTLFCGIEILWYRVDL